MTFTTGARVTDAVPGSILDFVYESEKQIFDFIVRQDPPLLNIIIICRKNGTSSSYLTFTKGARVTDAVPGRILDFEYESEKQIIDLFVRQDPPLLNIIIICRKKWYIIQVSSL